MLKTEISTKPNDDGKTIDVPVSRLQFKYCSRLLCMHGCVHYRRNPLCPPNGHDVFEMVNILQRYQTARIRYRIGSSASRDEVLSLRRDFHRALLGDERALRECGHHYALAFTTGACSQCEVAECTQETCNRAPIGRVPLCATGIDVAHLSHDILGLSVSQALQFWRYSVVMRSNANVNDGYLFLGAIFY